MAGDKDKLEKGMDYLVQQGKMMNTNNDKDLDGVAAISLQLNRMQKSLQENINTPISQKTEKGRNKDSWNVAINQPAAPANQAKSFQGPPLPPKDSMGDDWKENATAARRSLLETSQALEQMSLVGMGAIPVSPMPVSTQYSEDENRRRQQKAIQQKRRRRHPRPDVYGLMPEDDWLGDVSYPTTPLAEEMEQETYRLARDRSRQEKRKQSRADWERKRYGKKPSDTNALGDFGFPPPPPPKDILDQPLEPERVPRRIPDQGLLLTGEMQQVPGGPLPYPYQPPTPVNRTDRRGSARKFFDNLFGGSSQRDKQRLDDARDRMNQAEKHAEYQNKELQRVEENLRKATLDRENAKALGRTPEEMKPINAAVGLAKMEYEEKRKEIPKAQREAERSQQAFDKLQRQQRINQAGQGFGQASQLANALGLGGMGQILGHGQAMAQAAAGGLPVPGGIGLIGAGLGQMGQGVGQGLASQRLGGAMAGGGKAFIGAGLVAAGAIGGPAGLVAGASLATFGMFTKALGDSIESLRKWNDDLLEGHFRFAEFSASMAMIAAKQQREDIGLSRERGEFRANMGGARGLQQSRMDLERSLAPYEDILNDLQSRLASVFNRVAVGAVDRVGGILGPLIALLPTLAAWLYRDDPDAQKANRADDDYMRSLRFLDNGGRVPPGTPQPNGRPPRFRP